MQCKELLLIMLATPAAFAQSAKPQLSDEEVEEYWLMLQGVQHSVDDPGGTLRFLRQSGMSEAGAETFSQFALQGLADHLRAARERMARMCENQTALKASRIAFADALDENKAASAADKRALVSNIGVGLTAEDEEKLRSWTLAKARPLQIETRDIGQWIRSGQSDHVRGVEMACASAAEMARQGGEVP